MLERNKGVKCGGAAERLEIRQGDVLEILPTLARNHYDRILAPRPKEGAMDGDLGDGDSGVQFLSLMLPVLKQDGGECHWYDFVADHEFPACNRTRLFLERTCREHNLDVEVLHVARVGSVAMRQLRVCLDFRIHPGESNNTKT
jgi:tRNA G37 N-methylase Trm5